MAYPVVDFFRHRLCGRRVFAVLNFEFSEKNAPKQKPETQKVGPSYWGGTSVCRAK